MFLFITSLCISLYVLSIIYVSHFIYTNHIPFSSRKKLTKININSPGSHHGPDRLPALNYYSLGEPQYFFYDPEVPLTDEQGNPYIPEDRIIRLNQGQKACTDNDCVIGPYNYARYNIDNINLGLSKTV